MWAIAVGIRAVNNGPRSLTLPPLDLLLVAE